MNHIKFMHSQRILNAISLGISMHIVSLHCFGVTAWVQERTEPVSLILRFYLLGTNGKEDLRGFG